MHAYHSQSLPALHIQQIIPCLQHHAINLHVTSADQIIQVESIFCQGYL